MSSSSLLALEYLYLYLYLAHIVTKIISHYLVSTVLAAGVRCAAHLEPVFSLDLSNNKRLKNVTTPSILSRSSPLLISSQWGQIMQWLWVWIWFSDQSSHFRAASPPNLLYLSLKLPFMSFTISQWIRNAIRQLSTDFPSIYCCTWLKSSFVFNISAFYRQFK